MSLSIWILAGHSMYFPIRKQLFARLNSYVFVVQFWHGQ